MSTARDFKPELESNLALFPERLVNKLAHKRDIAVTRNFMQWQGQATPAERIEDCLWLPMKGEG